MNAKLKMDVHQNYHTMPHEDLREDSTFRSLAAPCDNRICAGNNTKAASEMVFLAAIVSRDIIRSGTEERRRIRILRIRVDWLLELQVSLVSAFHFENTEDCIPAENSVMIPEVTGLDPG